MGHCESLSKNTDLGSTGWGSTKNHIFVRPTKGSRVVKKGLANVMILVICQFWVLQVSQTFLFIDVSICAPFSISHV